MGEREGEGGGQEKRGHKGGLKALENGHSVWHKHAGNSWVFQEDQLGKERAKGYISDDPLMNSEQWKITPYVSGTVLLVTH